MARMFHMPREMRRASSALLPALSLCLLAALAGQAFVGARPALNRSERASSARRAVPADGFLDLAGIEPAVTGYVNIWKPLFLDAKASGLAPEAVLRWGHPAAMGTVLLAMGGYGTFLGWTTRFGNGEEVYPLNLGYKNSDMHKLLMGGALFFFFLGGQGGLVLLATAGEPLLTSAHSSTAVIGLSLMAIQAALGLTMGKSELARTVHAFFGTGVMLLLLVHMYFGLALSSAF